jgi:hypothetical protein
MTGAPAAGNIVRHMASVNPQHPPRRYLVFCRAGSNSLHRRLIVEDPQRNWDCCVSWYSTPVEDNIAEYYCVGGDNKLEGFLSFRDQFKSLPPYRYVLLADDDVYFEPGGISRFFEICDRYETYLAQPALRWRTHYNLNVTLANPACILRQVSYIEIMAPCLSAAAVEELIDTFAMSRSTWGVDWTWAGRLQGKRPIHVVDAVRIEHTKPMDKRDGAFYRKMKSQGIDPNEELRAARERFPDFVGMRTERNGHIYREGIPRFLRKPAMSMFEHLKFIARQRKKIVRRLHRLKSSRNASR